MDVINGVLIVAQNLPVPPAGRASLEGQALVPAGYQRLTTSARVLKRNGS
jgi:hypothetical protein